MRGNYTPRLLEGYGLQAPDGARCVVLACKAAETTYVARVGQAAPTAGAGLEVYQYTSRRIPDALYLSSSGEAGQAPVEVQCPPYSVTVVKWPAR